VTDDSFVAEISASGTWAVPAVEAGGVRSRHWRRAGQAGPSSGGASPGARRL